MLFSRFLFQRGRDFGRKIRKLIIHLYPKRYEYCSNTSNCVKIRVSRETGAKKRLAPGYRGVTITSAPCCNLMVFSSQTIHILRASFWHPVLSDSNSIVVNKEKQLSFSLSLSPNLSLSKPRTNIVTFSSYRYLYLEIDGYQSILIHFFFLFFFAESFELP